MSKHTVSVVIPCYNQAHFLLDSVRSAFSACKEDLEIIIINDGSTEKSSMASFSAVQALDSRVKIIHQENHGLAASRNVGIKLSKGDFIQFLDADDLLGFNKISHQLEQFHLTPSLDISITNYLLCDATRSHFEKPGESLRCYSFSQDDFLYKWERGFSIPIHCALFRKNILTENYFDETLRAKEDWHFWCRLACKRFNMALLDLHLAFYRRHGQSMCTKPDAMGKCFLQAAIKISNEFSPESEPLFIPRSVQWYNEYYMNQITSNNNLNNAQKVKSTNQVQKGEFVNKPIPSPIRHIKTETKISVVIPVFNHLDHLKRCILSALYQSYPACEVICVDDASTDSKVGELLQSLVAEHDSLKLISHKTNSGISASQNEAVKLANGEFIAFLDCDDFLHLDALKIVAELISGDPSLDYIFTDRFHVDADNYLIGEANYGGYPHLKNKGHYEALLDGMIASHLKVIRKNTYLKVGGCDQTLSGVQDWDLALKIAEVGKLEYIPKSLYYHRIHAQSVTQSQRTEQFRKTNIVRRHFQLVRYHNTKSIDSYHLPLAVAKNIFQTFEINSQYQEQNVVLIKTQISLEDLQKIWKEKGHCLFYLNADAKFCLINFLREYNSYFEYILCESPTHYAALLGYLWSDNVLLEVESFKNGFPRQVCINY